MDLLFGISIMGTLFCLIVIEYAVYRIKEEERIKMRLHEVRVYSPVRKK
jgi:protein-S-isoprenylcysteine O-methyltransferase Ste14